MPKPLASVPSAAQWGGLLLVVTAMACAANPSSSLLLSNPAGLTPDTLRFEQSDGSSVTWALPELWSGASAVLALAPVTGQAGGDNRWGDRVGPLFDTQGRWLQRQAVLSGQALVRPSLLLDEDSLSALFLAEAAARATGRGGWGSDWPQPIATLLDAPRPFAIVRGQVLSVREGRFTSYLTLIDASRSTLTLALDVEARGPWEARFGPISALKDRLLLVRGAVSEDKLPNSTLVRPRIDVRHWQQLQLLDSAVNP